MLRERYFAKKHFFLIKLMADNRRTYHCCGHDWGLFRLALRLGFRLGLKLGLGYV